MTASINIIAFFIFILSFLVALLQPFHHKYNPDDRCVAMKRKKAGIFPAFVYKRILSVGGTLDAVDDQQHIAFG